jgi:hypothetical protein
MLCGLAYKKNAGDRNSNHVGDLAVALRLVLRLAYFLPRPLAVAFPIDPWIQLGDPRLVLALLLLVIGLTLNTQHGNQ